MKAVRFDEYGEIDVLRVVDVPLPEPAHGQVLVQVKAAGINPGESGIRRGLLHARFPATFPEGSDLAGIVTKLGPGVVGWAAGDAVIGFTNHRASHAEYVVVEAENLTAKPAQVPWEVAGSLAVAGGTAYAAVHAVAPQSGDTIAVAGAAGGVGSIAVQLARRAGAQVIGIASPTHHDWLRAHGVTTVAYGADSDLADRLREAGTNAFIDAHGDGYVQLAIALGVAPQRIDTIADFAAVQEYGVQAVGSSAGMSAPVLADLAGLVAAGALDVPIAATFPLDEVRAAYALVEQRHTLGKIVLLP